jgi:hypothetical protein
MFRNFKFLAISQLMILCLSPLAHSSIFGEETAVLLNMLSNQLVELQRLSESVGIAKDQQKYLLDINEGIQKTTAQIHTLEIVIERAKGLNPTAIKSLSDLNEAIDQMKGMAGSLDQLVQLKLALSDEAVSSAALQSDTSYTMGQEMVKVGKSLHEESAGASPGRAQQITAAASSSQMVASGVQLQTLAQMVQLQAISLDLQKSQIERQLTQERDRNAYIRQSLTGKTTDPKKVTMKKKRGALP